MSRWQPIRHARSGRGAMRVVVAGLLLAAASGCVAERPAEPEGPDAVTDERPGVQADEPAAAPPVLDPLVLSLRSDERERLERHRASAARPRPDRLTIRLDDGSVRTFVDERVDGHLRHLYVYHGLFETVGAHLVEKVYVPEGRQYVLVHTRRGDMLEVDGPPVASPDGQRFVTTSLDLVAGHAPNRIRVYRITSTGQELEWELEPRDWGARAPRWLDERTIELERVEVDWSTEPLGETVETLRLEWRGDWVQVR